jgi:hypothetical protein
VLWLGAAPGRADTLPFAGSLSIQVQALHPVVATASGISTAGLAGGHLDSLGLAASTFSIAGQQVPITTPTVAPIKGLQATLRNGPAAFGLTARGALAGQMPIHGVSKVCLFKACANDPPGNISVPLSVIGAGGTATATGSVNLTVVGGPWTLGQAAIGTVTQMGFAHGPSSGTSSTGAKPGVFELVTPIFISTNIALVPVVFAFGQLTLRFVPEPSALSLLGASAGALLLLGRWKRGFLQGR